MHYSIAMELFRKLSKIFHIKFVFYMEIQYGNSIWKFNMEIQYGKYTNKITYQYKFSITCSNFEYIS